MAVIFSSEQETKCSISGVIFALAAVALVVGVYFLVRSSGDTRDDKLSQYDSAVTAWTSQYRSQFQDAAFTATTTEAGAAVVTMQTSTTTDPLNDPNVAANYEALKYESGTPSMLAAANYSVSATTTFSFTTRVPSSGATSSFSYGPVPLFTVDTLRLSKSASTARSMCHDTYKGIYDVVDNRCRVYKRLLLLCLQVELIGGEWRASADTGPGCLMVGNVWVPTSYTPLSDDANQVPAIVNGDTPAQFSDFIARLRSVHDPFLVAEQVTDATLDFGLTAAQLRGVGIVLLLLGLILFINPIMFVCQVRDMCIRDKAKQRDEFHPVMAGLGGPVPPVDDDSVGEFDANHEWSEEMLRAAHGQRGPSPATGNEHTPVLGAAQRKHPSNSPRTRAQLGQPRRHHAAASAGRSGAAAPNKAAGAGTLAGARAAVAYRGRVEMVEMDAGDGDGRGDDQRAARAGSRSR